MDENIELEFLQIGFFVDSGVCYLLLKRVESMIDEKVFPTSPGNEGHSGFARKFKTHLSHTGTGNQDGDSHLGYFEHHFRGKTSGGIENFVFT